MKQTHGRDNAVLFARETLEKATGLFRPLGLIQKFCSEMDHGIGRKNWTGLKFWFLRKVGGHSKPFGTSARKSDLFGLFSTPLSEHGLLYVMACGLDKERDPQTLQEAASARRM